MGKEIVYDDIVAYLESCGQPYQLLSTEADFLKLKKSQNKSGLYTKMLYRCVGCNNNYERSYACIKASTKIGMCKNCSEKHPRRNWAEVNDALIKNGYIPMFTEEEYSGVSMKAKAIACCGHEVETSIDSMLRHPLQTCRPCAIKYGADVYNWKGGYENEKIRFRKTYAFKEFVKQVLKRDNYTCVICHSNSAKTKLVVHHKDGYNWCVDKRTEMDNGVTLCEKCHNDFHKIYGRGDNTHEQFEEWSKTYYLN